MTSYVKQLLLSLFTITTLFIHSTQLQGAKQQSKNPLVRVVIVAESQDLGPSVLLKKATYDHDYYNAWAQPLPSQHNSKTIADRVFYNTIFHCFNFDIINTSFFKVDNDECYVYLVPFQRGKQLFSKKPSNVQDIRWFPIKTLNEQKNIAYGFKQLDSKLKALIDCGFFANTKPAFAPMQPLCQTMAGQQQAQAPDDGVYPLNGTGSLDWNTTSITNWFNIIQWQNRPAIIYFYNQSNPYYEFTNFFKAPIVVNQETFATSENYYQAQKFTQKPGIYKQIQDALYASDAFALAQTNKHLCDADWTSRSLQTMLTALILKFSQHKSLLDLLVSTQDAILVENANGKADPKKFDDFYGTGKDGFGKNHLGKMLMYLRHLVQQGRPLNSATIQEYYAFYSLQPTASKTTTTAAPAPTPSNHIAPAASAIMPPVPVNKKSMRPYYLTATFAIATCAAAAYYLTATLG